MDFYSKCDEICRKPRIWSDLLEKSLMENFFFCAVQFLCILVDEYLKLAKDKYGYNMEQVW